jgi:hypothetical protein
VAVALVVIAAGCSDARHAASPASSSVSTPTVTPSSPSTTDPTTGCADGAHLAAPDLNRPVYTATAVIDPRTGTVTGDVTIQFVPDLPIDEMVLRLWANAPVPAQAGIDMTLGDVLVNGQPAQVDDHDPTLTRIALNGSSPAGTKITVATSYRLVVPGDTPDRIARDDDTMRLGSFLPMLAWEPGVGWATDPPTALHAEAATSPAADYDVAVTIPDGYDVLGTGQPDASGHWTARAVRDFALSIGHFTTASATVAGVTIVVGVDRSVAEDPHRDLDLLTHALGDYVNRLGGFPWPQVSVAVTPGFTGGIEMPLHIMQAPASEPRSVVHELAHQWFYSLVGNNQARDPWLDEGLASYVEFVEIGSLDRNRARVIPAAVVGHAGEPMTFWANHGADYYDGVYVQAAIAVANLGTTDDVDRALRRYVACGAYRIATPADAIAALTAVFPDAAAKLAPAGLAG